MTVTDAERLQARVGLSLNGKLGFNMRDSREKTITGQNDVLSLKQLQATLSREKPPGAKL